MFVLLQPSGATPVLRDSPEITARSPGGEAGGLFEDWQAWLPCSRDLNHHNHGVIFYRSRTPIGQEMGTTDPALQTFPGIWDPSRSFQVCLSVCIADFSRCPGWRQD